MIDLNSKADIAKDVVLCMALNFNDYMWCVCGCQAPFFGLGLEHCLVGAYHKV